MMKTIERLQILKDKLIDPEFLNKKGLGNEMSFYIFDYDPADEQLIRQEFPDLLAYIEKSRPDLRFQVFDLYEIILQFFEKRNYMEKNFKAEERMGSQKVIEKMQQSLKIATERDEIINYIQDNLDENAITILTGVGKAFPILRSHIILNNLQSIITKKPLLMLYPGKFEHNSLKLFDIYPDDNYYRAFRIVER